MTPGRGPLERLRAALDARWDRVLALRDRCLASPRFQRWAARFPPTRRLARRRASALFDLCAGFVYAQVLQAVARLRVLEELADRPRTSAELAPAVGLSGDAMDRLLAAAASLEIVQRRSRGRWGLGKHGTAFVGNPAVAALVAHHRLFYRDLEDPVALLRGEVTGTELGRFWGYRDRAAGGGEPDAYSVLMAESVALLAEDVLEAYPVRAHRQLLDVAGGEGAFAAAVAARAPGLAVTVFDLPPVAERARARVAAAGLGDRVTVVGGDVFRDPLPGPVDLVSLVRVLHDHDDEGALGILVAVRRALAPGGVVLVAEPMSQPGETAGDAYFGFYLLAMGQGRPRSPTGLQRLLESAGFRRVRRRRTRRPLLTRLLSAEVGP